MFLSDFGDGYSSLISSEFLLDANKTPNIVDVLAIDMPGSLTSALDPHFLPDTWQH